jgi:hypothetical protein
VTCNGTQARCRPDVTPLSKPADIQSDGHAIAPPRRAVAHQVTALTLLFLGGGAVGARLAAWLVPESIAAQFFGMFVLPMAFATGLQSWLGSAVAMALWRTVTRGPATAAERHVERSGVPGGSFVFVPIALAFAAAAGLLVGMLGAAGGLVPTLIAYGVLGLGYGIACWRCARSGYLPFPQE